MIWESRMKKIYHSITEMVGRTPLLELGNVEKKHRLKAKIFAKCEFYNPLFSVKDRAALFMLEKAEKSGKISPQTVFLEATSGNTGIALAALCAARLCPNARQAMLASHVSAEPCGRRLLEALELHPLICAGMRLGEGSGAVAALALLDLALAVYNSGNTFGRLGIDAYTPQ